jgi:hypothetical protein
MMISMGCFTRTDHTQVFGDEAARARALVLHLARGALLDGGRCSPIAVCRPIGICGDIGGKREEAE